MEHRFFGNTKEYGKNHNQNNCLNINNVEESIYQRNICIS